MTQRKTESRTVALGARFSAEGAQKLRQKARASGMTVSSLINELVTTGEVNPRPKIDPIAIEQWRALAPVAANLNQLTRRINQGHLNETPEVEQELLALRCVLEEIRNQLIGEQGRAA